MVRAYRERRIYWPVFAAMFAGNAIILAFLPLLPATQAYQAGYYRGVLRGDVLASYRMFFYSRLGIALLVLVVAAACVVLMSRSHAARPLAARIGLKPEETATLVSFAFYPLIVFALGLIGTHTFAERFTLPAILGLSILPALGLRILLKRDGRLFWPRPSFCVSPVSMRSSRPGVRGMRRLVIPGITPNAWRGRLLFSTNCRKPRRSLLPIPCCFFERSSTRPIRSQQN